MKYVLKKQLRLGAVRFQLDETEQGLSGNVLESEGIHITPEEYRSGGRQGLYYRTQLKGKRVNAHQGQEKLRGALMGAFFLVLAFTAASIVLWPHPWVPVSAFLIFATVGGTLMAKDAEHGRKIYEAKKRLDEALIDSDHIPTKQEAEELEQLSRDVAFTVQLREDMYQAVLDKVVDDHMITISESKLLLVAQQILALSDVRIHELHRELISSAWLHALNEGHLMGEDFTWLGFVAKDLGITPSEFEEELALVEEMQHPTSGQTFEMGTDSKVTVTSDALVLRGLKAKTIPLSSIREVELNVDTHRLVIHQHGVHKPIQITTEHPFQLGQVLVAATETSAPV